MTLTTGADGSPRIEAPPTTRSTQPPEAGAPFVVTAPAPPATSTLVRARTEGLTGPAVVALSALLVCGGALLDVRRDATLGLGTGVAVVLASAAAPALVRFRSLATALVLPPLLVAGAATLIARLGGRNSGLRELVLDVGTTLALAAPLLFGVTALAVVVGLARLLRRVAGR